jgi:hypothetical protein
MSVNQIVLFCYTCRYQIDGVQDNPCMYQLESMYHCQIQSESTKRFLYINTNYGVALLQNVRQISRLLIQLVTPHILTKFSHQTSDKAL